MTDALGRIPREKLHNECSLKIIQMTVTNARGQSNVHISAWGLGVTCVTIEDIKFGEAHVRHGSKQRPWSNSRLKTNVTRD